MPNQKTKAVLLALGSSAFVLLVGGMIYQSTRPEKKVVPGGSVLIELDGADRAFLEQLDDATAPKAADPAFGGSAIEQSPQFDMETWQHLLKEELE